MRIQGRYWILTIKESEFSPLDTHPELVRYIKGQLEIGGKDGFRHWQLFVLTDRTTPAKLKAVWPSAHIELTRSAAAETYCWKEETRIAESQFEKGEKPFKRNSNKDWGQVRQDAVSGRFENIPDDVFIRLVPQEFFDGEKAHIYIKGAITN